jgi:hypothetical protein
MQKNPIFVKRDQKKEPKKNINDKFLLIYIACFPKNETSQVYV